MGRFYSLGNYETPKTKKQKAVKIVIKEKGDHKTTRQRQNDTLFNALFPDSITAYLRDPSLSFQLVVNLL